MARSQQACRNQRLALQSPGTADAAGNAADELQTTHGACISLILSLISLPLSLSAMTFFQSSGQQMPPFFVPALSHAAESVWRRNAAVSFVCVEPTWAEVSVNESVLFIQENILYGHVLGETEWRVA